MRNWAVLEIALSHAADGIVVGIGWLGDLGPVGGGKGRGMRGFYYIGGLEDMKLSNLVHHGLLFAVLAVVLASLAMACGGPGASDEERELTLEEVLESGGEKLAAISTAKFQMIDELESGAKFFQATLKTVEGEVKSPDGARMLVDVEQPAFGFVQIEIVAVGEQAYMKFSKDAPWLALPIEDVPFKFGRIGLTLSELLPIMENVAMVRDEFVGDVSTIRVDGDIVSEDLGNLITSVNPGHPVRLSYWFDQVDHTLRQFRIDGQIFDADGPETSRLVTMDVGVPVDIQLPEVDATP